MAHPHHAHRQHAVERSRVSHITRGYASGGAVHDDAADDAAQIKRMVKKSALKADGHKAKHRADKPHRAKGGKVKSGKTNVNVIVAPHHAAAQPAVPGPVAAPVPMARPPMPAPAMAPPGAMPPPGVPGMPPRRAGGRAYKKGGAVKSGPAWTESMRERDPFVVKSSENKDDQKDIGRGKPITYKTGGPVEASNKVAPATKLPGGSGGGLGRLAKEKRAKH